MSLPATIFAQQGGDNWIMIAIVVVLFLISAVGQLLAKIRGAQQGGPQQGRPQQQGRGQAQPPRAQRAEPERAGRGGGGVEDEIADFLRRATHQGAKPAPNRPEPGGMVEAELALDVEVIDDQPLGDRLRKHVGEYIEPERLSRESARLGDEVARTDNRIGEHLHEVFDHDVSQLATRPGESSQTTSAEEGRLAQSPQFTVAEVRPVAAVGLAAMLANVENLRQAIVINEILQRPSDRW